jgi:hypothetical protein
MLTGTWTQDSIPFKIKNPFTMSCNIALQSLPKTRKSCQKMGWILDKNSLI